MDNINRKYRTIKSWFRIGHTKLTHERSMAKEDIPSYWTCGTQLTTKHSLTECYQYGTQRSESDVPDRPHKNLDPQIQEKDIIIIIFFFKQIGFYKLT